MEYLDSINSDPYIFHLHIEHEPWMEYLDGMCSWKCQRYLSRLVDLILIHSDVNLEAKEEIAIQM